MKLVINKDRSVIPVGTWGTVNENNYEILEFEFPAELEHFNKRIVYYLDDERVWDAIVGNKAYITNAITKKEHVKAYVWLTDRDDDIEKDIDFRTMLFEMNFYENENADGIVPTEEQVDGFNTMLTAMNAKIDEVDALEQTIETAEAQRQEAEATRVSNENTRESNESTRQTNEQTRQLQEAERERRTDEAIGNIEDKTAEYNANAEEKTNEFNQNATQKTNEFNSNYTQKVNDFNANASSKESAFNSNASSKTSAFNSNAETKTNAFNTNATNKTNDFNSNATEKTTAFDDNASTKTSEFNSNAESKTNTFNDNATQKTTNFDNNASEKTDEFNTNAQNKIDEYDEHTEELQQKIDNNSENIDYIIPKNTSISDGSVNFIEDAIDYKIFEIEIEGNSSQNGTPTVDSPIEKDVVKGEILLVKSGAQLFDINTITLRYYMNIDGTLQHNVNAFYSDFIPVLPSATIKITDASYGTRVIEFNENKEYVTGAIYATGTTRTIQLNDNTHYIVVSDNTINDKYKEMVVCAEYMNLIDDVYTDNIINKINLGNNLINKLFTYDKDVIKVDKKGKIVFNKNIERLVITGNENIQMRSETYTNPDESINHMFAVPVPTNRRIRTQRYVESNFGYYQADIRPQNYNNNIVEFNDWFYIVTNKYQTLEEFVAWVKDMYENGTPLYIDYMITPIQIDLGNIEKLSTTEGYNYVKTTTNIETNTNVQYALDIKKYADKKLDNLDSRLALLE